MPSPTQLAILRRPTATPGPVRTRTPEEEAAIRAEQQKWPYHQPFMNTLDLLLGALGLADEGTAEQPNRWARGGALLSALPMLGSLRRVSRLPIPYAPENAANTAITTTGPTYDKAYALLQQLLGKANPRVLDYGAGRGLASQKYGFESFEPYVQDFTPTFRAASEIPKEAYEGVLNLNMLNVVPAEARREAVENIIEALRPSGAAVVTTRGRDVLGALKTPGSIPGSEPMSVITSRGTYQKGFMPQELMQYLKSVGGRFVSVEPTTLKVPASAILRKR